MLKVAVRRRQFFKKRQKNIFGVLKTQENPYSVLEKKYPVGSELEGIISSISEYALYLRIDGLEIDAFLHCNDLTYSKDPETELTKYKKGGFYNWHTDNDIVGKNEPPVRKISMTLLLSPPNEFEGGDLEFMTEGNKPPQLLQGQAIFFCSLIRHRVSKVKKGIRRSLVMWFGGPPFK